MPYVTTDDGARIHYRDTGGGGYAVVLMHGIFLDTDMWAPQEASLAPDYRVISIDARGHGLTEDPDTPFDYWRLAWDVWAVVDHLKLDKIVAGGLFQGGWIALRMALLYPSRVRGLILIGSRADAYEVDERVAYEQILMDTWILGDTPMEAVAAPIAAQLIGGDREGHRRVWLDKWNAGDRRRLRLAGRALIDREGIEHMIKDITAPALLMHGSGDQVFTPARTAALAQQLGGPTQVETIDEIGAAHAVTWTHPELTDPLILTWLDSLPS
ncbi:alpha/beta fold hydrolase [Nocardia sp. CNY236]|uniref:alpha/beta fold hydrolase n=1 Tax=Nocardia sp. CNY236 TaxID=1169152 RepID=UPI000419B76F|nr:alpha/beta hydrolase [Nocardia sp. CNY236]